MKTFTVYFQICGKKLKKTFESERKTDIHKLIIDTLIIDKIEGIIEEKNDPLKDDPQLRHYKSIFGMT